VLTSVLRWQTDQGMRMRQEYGAFLIDSDGGVQQNSEKFSEWLKLPAQDGPSNLLAAIPKKELYRKGERAMHSRLAEVSNMDLHPENFQVLTGCFLGAV
jgi:hypothetical protein